MGCQYKASRIAGLSGFGLLLGLSLIATALVNIIYIADGSLNGQYKDWIPLDNLPGYISGFFSVLSGSFGLSLLCMSTPASSASCIVASALAFSIIAMLSSAAALIVNINSVLAIETGDSLWNINAAQNVMDYFGEDVNDILVIMLEVSAGLNFANLIIQLSIFLVICCSVAGFCCAPASVDAPKDKGHENYAMENGSVGNIDDLASFASSGSIEIPFYNGNRTPAFPNGQAPAPSTYQDIPAPDYSTS